MAIADSIRAAVEAGEEAIKDRGSVVPILTGSEREILDLYYRCGRDLNGRVLISEENAMLARLRRLGWRFSEPDVLECWDAIGDEEAKFRAEKPE